MGRPVKRKQLGCVYVAVNKVNRKRYVGYTTGPLSIRRGRHLEWVVQNSMTAFHCALRKYGAKSFLWFTLLYSDDIRELQSMEKYCIRLIGTKPPSGYNLTDGGDGTPGRARTSDERRRISLKLKGTKMGNANPTKRQEVRDKISKALTGKKLTAEHKANVSRAMIGMVKSQETCRRISEGKKGKPFSEAHKRALRAAWKRRAGWQHSEETKKKMSKAQKKRYRRLKGARP